MNELQVFENAEFGSVRTVEVNGEPYLVGKDVAEILGYSNTSDALIKHIDNEDKLTSQIATSGQNREMTIINESGLYSLILSSKLPTAKKFKRWVTSEVLPSIRKHGMYAKQQSLNLNGLSPELQMFNQMFQAVANQEMKVNQLEVKQEETSKKLDTALDIFTSAIEPDWKTQINSKINQICKEHRLNYCMVRRDLYSELENAAKCNLSARVRNHQARLKKSGALYKEISAVTKIDVVANDCKLQAIFDGIVKKFQAKYVQGDNVQEGLIC